MCIHSGASHAEPQMLCDRFVRSSCHPLPPIHESGGCNEILATSYSMREVLLPIITSGMFMVRAVCQAYHPTDLVQGPSKAFPPASRRVKRTRASDYSSPQSRRTEQRCHDAHIRSEASHAEPQVLCDRLVGSSHYQPYPLYVSHEGWRRNKYQDLTLRRQLYGIELSVTAPVCIRNI